MMTAPHQFETPQVHELVLARADTPQPPAREDTPQPPVLLRVAPADAQRILRALDDATLNFAPTPNGANGASAYRRLAAEVRNQAKLAPEAWHRRLAT